jgi:hypothetical protein
MGKMHSSTFQYLKPSPQQIAEMSAVRVGFEAIYATIDAFVPEGRYKAMAISKLEEAAMFANKGVTRDSDGTPREGAEVIS